MKKFITPTLLALLAVTAPVLFSNCSSESNPVSAAAASSLQKDALDPSVIEDFPIEPLSTEEAQGLAFMREEEKLARDVYAVLYQNWGMRIFSNISASEETHTQAVKALILRYELTDPVVDDAAGVFADSALSALYAQLVEAGGQSLVEALKVGAAIEEIDILDLKHQLDEVVDNEDIAFVYGNLMRGSENHLRAFVRTLERQGETYTPQHLDAEDYEAILASTTGNGRPW